MPVTSTRRARVQEAEPARESVMTEVMEIDEAHAIDHRSCVRVLIMRCDTGFTVLNPAYQNLDRRDRAGVTHGDRDDRRMEKVAGSVIPVLFKRFSGQPLYLGWTRSCGAHVSNN